MQISLEQTELEIAISNHLKTQGINREVKNVEFSVTRNPSAVITTIEFAPLLSLQEAAAKAVKADVPSKVVGISTDDKPKAEETKPESQDEPESANPLASTELVEEGSTEKTSLFG